MLRNNNITYRVISKVFAGEKKCVHFTQPLLELFSKAISNIEIITYRHHRMNAISLLLFVIIQLYYNNNWTNTT